MTTVLIAAAEFLGPLKERGEFTDALAFADTDALRALECITRQRPQVVALERMFAATSRGNALVNRIKADPALSGCDIRIVSHERPSRAAAAPAAGPDASPPPSPIEPATPAGVEPPADATAAAATPADVAAPPASTGALDTTVPEAAPPFAAVVTPPPALDQNGTRWAPRFEIGEGVELLVDGRPATLVDMSVSGAQIVSHTSLRPNQRVRLLLSSVASLRLVGWIAWAQFEMPQTGPRYRAGIRFQDPDTDTIDAFLQNYRK